MHDLFSYQNLCFAGVGIVGELTKPPRDLFHADLSIFVKSWQQLLKYSAGLLHVESERCCVYWVTRPRPDVNDRGCCGWGPGRRSGQPRSPGRSRDFGPEPEPLIAWSPGHVGKLRSRNKQLSDITPLHQLVLLHAFHETYFNFKIYLFNCESKQFNNLSD